MLQPLKPCPVLYTYQLIICKLHIDVPHFVFDSLVNSHNNYSTYMVSIITKELEKSIIWTLVGCHLHLSTIRQTVYQT